MPQTVAARYLAQLRASTDNACRTCFADATYALRTDGVDAVMCLACGARATVRDEGEERISALWTAGTCGGPT